MRRKDIWIGSAAVLAALFMPADVRGQEETGTMTGTVRDTTGLALPGVTVEAASPALIEKVRTVTTDDDGRFQIVDLRPGTYLVSFELTGFSITKREGVAIPAAATATVNADLRLRVIGESITLSGPAPTVEVRKVARQKTASMAAIDAKAHAHTSGRPAAISPRRTTSQSDTSGTSGDVSPSLANPGSRTAGHSHGVVDRGILGSALNAASFQTLLNRLLRAPLASGSALLTPTQTLVGRLATFAAQIDF